MVDISSKPLVTRRAVATGLIKLKPSTLEAIQMDKVPKGDVLSVARVAAIQAVKRTPELVPLTHPIPITSVKVEFGFEPEALRAEVEVKSVGQTGVEMEALAGVTGALLAVWDMVKGLEKDERGQYPNTAIQNIRVLRKVKGEQNGA